MCDGARGRGGRDADEGGGQKPADENAPRVFTFPELCQHLIARFCAGHTDLMVLGFYKMTSSVSAGGMSYALKLGCQARLGFASKTRPQ